jgi:hypothetical protein
MLLLLFGNLLAHGQDNPGYLDLIKAERNLEDMFASLYNPEIVTDKSGIFQRIDSTFLAALSIPGSFDYQWNKLDMIGKLTSSDQRIRVFSWVWMVSPEQYRYSAYLQVQGKSDASETFPLIQGDNENIKKEEYEQRLDDWHGKIYYDLVTTKYRRRTYYTLMGADYNSSYTNMKSIEVVGLRRGHPVFLDQRFFDEGTVRDRVIFEYSSDVSMVLRFDERLGMIVFDHLAPLHPIYHGMYQFYGPDGSYDGYEFKEGLWVRTEDVDARNER